MVPVPASVRAFAEKVKEELPFRLPESLVSPLHAEYDAGNESSSLRTECAKSRIILPRSHPQPPPQNDHQSQPSPSHNQQTQKLTTTNPPLTPILSTPTLDQTPSLALTLFDDAKRGRDVMSTLHMSMNTRMSSASPGN